MSLTLLATALLGLAAAASVAHQALRSAEREERTVRHAAALLDSLTFSGAAGAAGATGVRIRDGVVLRWEIAAGPGGEARLEATYDAGTAPVTLTFRTRQVPRLAVRRP